jgi:hypothetical protein
LFLRVLQSYVGRDILAPNSDFAAEKIDHRGYVPVEWYGALPLLHPAHQRALPLLHPAHQRALETVDFAFSGSKHETCVLLVTFWLRACAVEVSDSLLALVRWCGGAVGGGVVRALATQVDHVEDAGP